MKHTYKLFVLALTLASSTFQLSAQTPITICPDAASFSSMTRGYYFTAPANFTICGLYVEDDRSTSAQSVEIVRFTAGPPPAYSATTNSFVSLFYQNNYVPNSMVAVPNITINAGDVIGIYGSRATVNSYGASQCPVTIQGFPVTLYRSGMQFDLATQQMHDIWNENNSPIGRITMYTNCCPAIVAPVIAGPTTPCIGSTSTYTVPAQAGATGYTWTVPAGATITSGQNTNSLNVTWNATPGGQICMDWTDGCVTSPQTCLNVTVNPAPLAPSATGVTICANNSTTLTATAPGGTYEWFDAAAAGTLLFTGTTYTTPIINATTNYWVQTTLNGCVSPRTMVTVTIAASLVVNAGLDATICNGQSTPLSVSPNGAGYSYVWNEPANPNFSNIYNPSVSPTATTSYSVIVTDATNCVGTDTVIITVNPLPTAITPINTPYCNGDNVPASTFTSNPIGATFAWTNSNTTIGLAASGTGNTPAFNAVNNTGAPVISTITVTPTLNSCVGSATNYTITVNPTPTATIPINATYCHGENVPISAFVSTPIGATFAWTNSNAAIGLAASGTGNIPVFTATNTTGSAITGTITVTPTVNGCAGTSSNYTITVNPLPTTTTPVNTTYCNGINVPASAFTSNPVGATFAWTNSNTTIGLAASGTGNTPVFNAVNNTAAPIVSTITVTSTLNSCVGPATNYTITVNPNPTINLPINATYCDGDNVPTSTFTSTPVGATFAWTNSNTTIGLAASGTGNVPVFTAVNTTGVIVSGIITVTPTLNGCAGAPSNYTINVSPAIVINNTVTQISCFGANDGIIVVAPTGGTPNYSYNWTTGGIGNSPLANNLTPGPITVTVSDISGCSTDSTFVIIEPAQINYISFNADIKQGCVPLDVEFYNTTDTTLITSLSWNLGNGDIGTTDTISTTYNTPGSYAVELTVTDNNNCTETLPLSNYITVYENPTASFSSFPAQPTVFDPSVSFTDLSFNNIVAWNWNFDGLGISSLQNPSFTFPEDTGSYNVSLTVTDINSCIGVITNIVSIFGESAVFIPNSFSPDINGLNDGFGPKGFGVSPVGYSFAIFNRWGELIFKSNQPFETWNGTYKGKQVLNNVFVWKLDYNDLEGKGYHRTGHLTILK